MTLPLRSSRPGMAVASAAAAQIEHDGDAPRRPRLTVASVRRPLDPSSVGSVTPSAGPASARSVRRCATGVADATSVAAERAHRLARSWCRAGTGWSDGGSCRSACRPPVDRLTAVCQSPKAAAGIGRPKCQPWP